MKKFKQTNKSTPDFLLQMPSLPYNNVFVQATDNYSNGSAKKSFVTQKSIVIIVIVIMALVVLSLCIAGLAWAQFAEEENLNDPEYYTNNPVTSSADAEYGTQNLNLVQLNTSTEGSEQNSNLQQSSTEYDAQNSNLQKSSTDAKYSPHNSNLQQSCAETQSPQALSSSKHDFSISIQDYISSNADKKYTSSIKCDFGNLIILKQTLVNKNLVSSSPTLANLSDYIEDNAMLGTIDSNCAVYNLDDSSKYYVGFVDTMSGAVKDWDFAHNDIDGNMFDDCIFEPLTGLIYIPKSYTKGHGEDGKESMLEVQCQLLYSVVPDSNGKVATNIFVEINNQLYGSSCASMATYNALDLKIPIDVGVINEKNFEVIINDSCNITSKCTYLDGTLYLPVSACSVSRIKLTVNKDDILQAATSVFSQPLLDTQASPATMNLLPGVKVNTSNLPAVGSQICFHTSNIDSESDARGNPYYPYLYGTWGVDGADPSKGGDMQGSWMMWGYVIGCDLSDLDINHLVQPQTYVNFQFYSNTEGNVFLDGANPYLPAKCIHIGSEWKGEIDMTKIYCRVLYIDENNGYAVIGFASAKRGDATQECAGYYKVAYESKGGIELNKSTQLAWSEENPNYSLNDCKFNIYYDEACTSPVGASITTDAKGYAKSGLHDFKKGTYYLREDSSHHGQNYLLNSNSVGRVTVTPNSYSKVAWDNTGNKLKSYTDSYCVNMPAYCNNVVHIVKADEQTGSEMPEGAASFAGAQYEFEHFTDYFSTLDAATYRQVHAASYRRHWVMSTNESGMTGIHEDFANLKVSGDDFYRDSSGKIICPLGSYVIHETVAPEGYLLSEKYYVIQVGASSVALESSSVGAESPYAASYSTIQAPESTYGATSKIFDASSGVEMEQLYDSATGRYRTKLAEQVKRGDVQFQKHKVEEGYPQQKFAKVPFKITSITTGEWHVVVTDENGCVDTSSNSCPHTTETNYFDCLLDEEGNVPQNGINEEVISEFFETKQHCGYWFCFDANLKPYIRGETCEPASSCNSLGALPYDSYIIEELPVSYNSDYMLFSEHFSVDTHEFNIDLGTFINRRPSDIRIETEASSLSGQKTVELSDNAKIIDRINYYGLDAIAGKEYYFKTFYVDSKTKETVSDVVRTPFWPSSSDGYVDVTLSIDTRALAGKSLNCQEELYSSNGELLAQHKDLSDTHQTVDVQAPEISTQLFESESHSKVVNGRSKNLQLIDYLYYSQLSGGENYRVETQLVNKSTGECLLDSESNFVAKETGTGVAELSFAFDATTIDATTDLVAFEYLYSGDVLIASHCDITDTNQTIKIVVPTPKILSTTLTPLDSETHTVEGQDYVKLRDVVNYSGLEREWTYRVVGKLVNEDGSDFCDSSGEFATYTAEFSPVSDESNVVDGNICAGQVSIFYNVDISNVCDGTKIISIVSIIYEDEEPDEDVGEVRKSTKAATQELAVHADLNDENETILILKPTQDEGESSSTQPTSSNSNAKTTSAKDSSTSSKTKTGDYALLALIGLSIIIALSSFFVLESKCICRDKRARNSKSSMEVDK